MSITVFPENVKIPASPKALNLMRVANRNSDTDIIVPVGLLISSVITKPILEKALTSVMGIANPTAHNILISGASSKLQTTVFKIAVKELECNYLDLAIQRLISNTNTGAFVVRSSSTEEGGLNCYSGIFTSLGNIDSAQSIVESAALVLASSFSLRALEYVSSLGTDEKIPTMEVIIQEEMPESKVIAGGVLHSMNRNIPGHPVISITAGKRCRDITSGGDCPEEYLVYKPWLEAETSPVIEKTPGVHTQRNGSFFLEEKAIRSLCKTAIELELHFESPIIIEWEILKSGNLCVYQCDSTHELTIPCTPAAIGMECEGSIDGAAVGTGTFTGQAIKVRTISEAKKRSGKDKILVTNETNPDWDGVITSFGGLVTSSGGRTSHTSRLAYEKGVLAIVGAGDISAVADGKVYKMICSGPTGMLIDNLFSNNQVESHTMPRGIRVWNPWALTQPPGDYPLVVLELEYIFRKILRVSIDDVKSSFHDPFFLSAMAGYQEPMKFIRAKLAEALNFTKIVYGKNVVLDIPFETEAGLSQMVISLHTNIFGNEFSARQSRYVSNNVRMVTPDKLKM